MRNNWDGIYKEKDLYYESVIDAETKARKAFLK
jgi:hypothetical protein